MRRSAICLILSLLCAACDEKATQWDWTKYQAPDWRRFQPHEASAASRATAASAPAHAPDPDRVTFRDLQTESDRSLAERLLGAVGKRIAYIDRQEDRWRYYRSADAPADRIDLYTHPAPLGSQYGLCGVEKYSIRFGDSGRIAAVSMAKRYGVEGPVLQKSNFDWDYYEKRMCAAAPASHARSYFPAADESAAQNLAMLMLPVIDLAGATRPLPYKLGCHDPLGHSCTDYIRRYLGKLRLGDIDDFSLANCPPVSGPQAICFTVWTGKNEIGPFPKMITVKGSTYRNDVRVDSVDVDQGFTMS